MLGKNLDFHGLPKFSYCVSRFFFCFRRSSIILILEAVGKETTHFSQVPLVKRAREKKKAAHIHKRGKTTALTHKCILS